jgi:hypothetical protein
MNPWALEVLWAAIVKLCGLLVIFYGIGTFVYQTFLWLRDGTWTPLELRLAWQSVWQFFGLHAPEPTFSWLGVQKIAVWLLDSSLGFGLIVLGVIVLVFGIRLQTNVNATIAEYKRVTGVK